MISINDVEELIEYLEKLDNVDEEPHTCEEEDCKEDGCNKEDHKPPTPKISLIEQVITSFLQHKLRTKSLPTLEETQTIVALDSLIR